MWGLSTGSGQEQEMVAGEEREGMEGLHSQQHPGTPGVRRAQEAEPVPTLGISQEDRSLSERVHWLQGHCTVLG